MRLHKNLCYAVIDGILEIFNEKKYADKVIQKLLKRDKRWGSRDRGFIAETTYDIVRWKRLYCEISGVKEPFMYVKFVLMKIEIKLLFVLLRI